MDRPESGPNPVQSKRFTLLVKGGEVLDPATQAREPTDVGIDGREIAALAPDLSESDAETVFDASGLLVTPGLVDLHTHVFDGIGGSVDPNRVAWRTGVTSWIDAGTAGAHAFATFRRFVLEPARLQLRAFLNISLLGCMLAPTAELSHPAFLDSTSCARVLRRNRDFLVGVKARIDRDTVGTLGLEPLHLARRAADEAGVPLMVHIGHGPPMIDEVLAVLRRGDILTHCWTGLSMRLIDEQGKPRASFVDARERGVIFDIAHGMGSFSFETAEAMATAGYFPDVISSDVHAESIESAMIDLPNCINKLVAVGMPLEQALSAATLRPAQAVGLDAGTLRVGYRADLAVFEWRDEPTKLWDSYHLARTGPGALLNVATFSAGRLLPPETRDRAPSSWAPAETPERLALNRRVDAELRRAVLPAESLPGGFGAPEPVR